MTMTPVIGNYTCGSDYELIDLFVWTTNATYQLGDVVDVYYYVNCTIIGDDYELEVTLNGNFHDQWNWTAPYDFFSNQEELTNLSVGYHCINATLSDSDGFIDFELACF